MARMNVESRTGYQTLNKLVFLMSFQLILDALDTGVQEVNLHRVDSK